VPKQAKFFSTRVASIFLACGRNSLPVYAVSVVLSCAGYVAISESDATNFATVAVNVIGILALFILAYVLDWRRKNARNAADGSVGQAPTLVRRFVG
jgi:OpgC protein